MGVEGVGGRESGRKGGRWAFCIGCFAFEGARSSAPAGRERGGEDSETGGDENQRILARQFPFSLHTGLSLEFVSIWTTETSLQ